MAITDDNKLRSIAGIVGIGSIALLGVTACDDGGTEDDADTGVEEPADEGADDGMDDGAEGEEDDAEL